MSGRGDGAFAWMARNSVAANILMLVLLVGGLLMIPRVKQEVFPEFDLDIVLINVPYPGASPEEVEQGVVLPIEEAVRGVDGVKEVRSTAQEGVGVVTLELLLGTDADRALADVKSAVDRIGSFPTDVEEPVVTRPQMRGEVISLVVYGEASEANLRSIAERVRDDLLTLPGITTVELSGVRPLEISVDIPQERLREYGLTYEQVAAAIRQASVEVPAGAVRTRGGEILLRTTERRLRGEQFAEIVVLSRPDGTRVTVGDLGTVTDGFREVDTAASYDGHRAVMVKVFRVGDQTPLDIAATVQEYIREHEGDLPPGVRFATWNDRSEFYRDRIDLLMKNAYLGLVLVLVCLGLFLELRLAFWVTLGIPISFIGSILFLGPANVSINMISLFAFILTLGMVVDDAIVIGEAVYTHRTRGMAPLAAALAGLREVSGPVIFAILTTCIFFVPLMFVPGVFGKFFINIPMVVIIVLLLSLVESLLVLPAHLAHVDKTHLWLGGITILGLLALPIVWAVTRSVPFPLLFVVGIAAALLVATRIEAVTRTQQRFSRWIEWLIESVYQPLLALAMRRRWITLAAAFATLVACVGLVAGGRVERVFFPRIDSDFVIAQLEMPFGTPAAQTEEVQRQLLDTATEAITELAGGADPESLVRGRFALLGGTGTVGTGPGGQPTAAGGHLAEAAIFLVPSDRRPFSASELSESWRRRMGAVPGIESLQFVSTAGGPGGQPIDFQLTHPDLATLERAAARLAEGLGSYSGVIEIDDGFEAGKEQLDFTLRPEARARGVTEAMLARQLRDAFFGAEAVRQQRGRDELRVYVRRPFAERESIADVERLMVRTPDGGEIPLLEAADVRRGRSYTAIRRVNGQRRANVTADVDASANANRVIAQANAEVIPRLQREFPALRVEPGGDAARQGEVMGSLATGFLFALFVMGALLAIAFRSYMQPVIIATAIPFGLVGAVLGHLVLGYDLSLMSMMGLVALAGVAVNDSLVLISAINDLRREEGMSALEAVLAAGPRRFRPILLTSLTTFLGLSPMILESSVGARFLIPMAISLGFGVMFATFVTLLVVPALYLVVDGAERWVFGRLGIGHGDATPAAAAPEPGE